MLQRRHENDEKPLVFQYICLLGVLRAVGWVGTVLRATKFQRAPPKVTSGSPNVASGSKMLIFHWFYNGFRNTRGTTKLSHKLQMTANTSRKSEHAGATTASDPPQ